MIDGPAAPDRWAHCQTRTDRMGGREGGGREGEANTPFSLQSLPSPPSPLAVRYCHNCPSDVDKGGKGGMAGGIGEGGELMLSVCKVIRENEEINAMMKELFV